MRVWEYIWMNVVETEDESIDKQEVMKREGGERIVKDSIRHHFGIHLCLSGLHEKMPEEVKEWWMHAPTPCMYKNKDRPHEECWNNFLNKRVGGFVPAIIKGGARTGQRGSKGGIK